MSQDTSNNYVNKTGNNSNELPSSVPLINLNTISKTQNTNTAPVRLPQPIPPTLPPTLPQKIQLPTPIINNDKQTIISSMNNINNQDNFDADEQTVEEELAKHGYRSFQKNINKK